MLKFLRPSELMYASLYFFSLCLSIFILIFLFNVLLYQPSSFTETWKAVTLKGITKGRKWTFDTSTDNTLVNCYSLSSDKLPFETSSLLLEGEKKKLLKEINNEHNIKTNNTSTFNVDDFMKVGIKVDVIFHDTKEWFCGSISKISSVQVTVDFINNDNSVRVKPKEGEIRLCSHSPQLKTPSKQKFCIQIIFQLLFHFNL